MSRVWVAGAEVLGLETGTQGLNKQPTEQGLSRAEVGR